MENIQGSRKVDPNKIIIVDDDPRILDFLSMCLSLAGYTVGVANTVEQADKLAGAIPAAALWIVDFQMRECDNAAQRVIDTLDENSIPGAVMGITASKPDNQAVRDSLRSLTSRLIDGLKKPFELDEIESATANLINQSLNAETHFLE